MKTVRTALLQALTILVVGFVLAFSINAVRVKGAIKPSKNYFDKGEDLLRNKGVDVRPADSPVPSQASFNGASNIAAKSAPPTGTNGQPVTSVGTAPAATVSASENSHPKHPYQEIDFPAALDVLKDPNTAGGLNVFVDARKQDAFSDGHIPGAVQCFPYEIDLCLDVLQPAVSGAEKVIVYCGGGECEDSISMCRELIDLGVPYEAVYLYSGGWKDWSSRKGPEEKESQ